MKRAVSVSLGSRERDKEAQITLLGQPVYVRREGWDGDVAQTAARFAQLDGQVDALGTGGIDLWVGTETTRYPLRQAHRLVRHVKQTPVVDGSGLKQTLERHVAAALPPPFAGGKVLLVSGLDRYGMARSFWERGHEVLCGDLGFALGWARPVRTPQGLERVARLLLPLLGCLPIRWLYPTGAAQKEIRPKFEQWYAWADIIAGDCLYIVRHMPSDLQGKIIVTNTTTATDRAHFAERGVRHVITTTPLIDGRSFGTNLLEAALTAVAGQGRPLTPAELRHLLAQLQLKPTLHQLG